MRRYDGGQWEPYLAKLSGNGLEMKPLVLRAGYRRRCIYAPRFLLEQILSPEAYYGDSGKARLYIVMCSRRIMKARVVVAQLV